MEPHREDQQKALELGATPKPRRFRIVKLEERIAPSRGGYGTNNTCAYTCTCVPTAFNCTRDTCGCGW
jgi:hypothetical protein